MSGCFPTNNGAYNMNDINKFEEGLEKLEAGIQKLELDLANKVELDWKKLKVMLTALVALLGSVAEMIQNEKIKKKIQKIVNIMDMIIQALPNS